MATEKEMTQSLPLQAPFSTCTLTCEENYSPSWHTFEDKRLCKFLTTLDLVIFTGKVLRGLTKAILILEKFTVFKMSAI